jgi:hypothetical protein
MKIKTLFFLLIASLLVSGAYAQSNTTEALQKKFGDARAFFFYNNTLRMLNQKEDKAFDELIKGIEKMKFLMIHKDNKSFDYKKLVGEYKSEAFEEMMTSRHEGKSFDVFVKEKEGKTKGMLVLVNDSTDLYVLDIVGSIALNQVTKLYETIDQSSDIGRKIKEFANDGDDKKKEDQKDGKKTEDNKH